MPTSNTPAQRPWTSAHDAPDFGFEAVLEAQTRLWNHLLDANRTLWSFYTPWLQLGPWAPNGADDAAHEVGTEPATTADGIPDAMELQARSWNRFLDAHRSFWSAVSWPVPATPWTAAVASNDPAPPAEKTTAPTPARKKPARRSGGR